MNGLLDIKLRELYAEEHRTSYQKKTMAMTMIMTDRVTTLKEAKNILTKWLKNK